MINILYENKDIVFCIKPVGLSSESDLPNALREQLKSEIYTLHRLDTPVGGVMLYAKTKKVAAKFSKKIADNTDFEKSYFALCEGNFEEKEGIMEDLLFKDARKNKSFVVKKERKGVKKAALSYKVISEGIYKEKNWSLVSVTLHTGRSHQIRVQFASRKHPLIGDGKYGSTINSPIGLYSYRISTDGMDFSHIPPDEFPWNITKAEQN